MAAVACVHVAAFVFYFQATMIRHPFGDMIIFIGNFLDYQADGDLLRYLWMPHTQHRMVWTRLVTALDVSWFNGVSYPFMIFAGLSLIAVPIIIGWQIVNANFMPTLRYAASLTVIMLALTSVNAVDCSIPIEDIYPHTLVFSVISFALFVTAYDGSKWAHIQRAGALVAACAAGLASAVGLVVWPILLWRAWRTRRCLGWWWVATVVGVACAFIGVYLLGMPLPRSVTDATNGQSSFYTLEHILKVGEYFLTYMGLPETRHPALLVPGKWLGAILTIVAVVCLIQREILWPIGSRLERLASCLIMFSLATAVLAAVGRVDELPEVAVPVRYSLYLLPLQIGILCLLLPWLDRQWPVPARRLAIQAALLACATLWALRQFPAGVAAVTVTREITATIDRFKSGIREPRMLSLIGADIKYAERVFELMKEKALYVDAMEPEKPEGPESPAE